MGNISPEASNLVSKDVQAPVSGTCEDAHQDEDEMLRRAFNLSLRNDDAPECEPRPQSKLENYQYSPLPTTDKTIRLLCVLPADDIADPLVCQIYQVRLIDKPEYAALSYTWGPPIFDHHVICDGRRLAITAHLDAALRRCRKTTWWMLWVDALCIDQSNIPERNSQVSIMKHIYSQASRTCVYLGEACLQDEDALKVMCALEELAQFSKRYSLAELKNMKSLDAITPRVRHALIRFIELKNAGLSWRKYRDYRPIVCWPTSPYTSGLGGYAITLFTSLVQQDVDYPGSCNEFKCGCDAGEILVSLETSDRLRAFVH